jgi:hypothetical protein
MPKNEKEMRTEADRLGILTNPSTAQTNPRAKLISHMYWSHQANRSPFEVTM